MVRPKRLCACGCGGETSRTWVQGHDGEALREALEDLGFGSLAAFTRAVSTQRVIVLPPHRQES